jgi:hypothetical protein
MGQGVKKMAMSKTITAEINIHFRHSSCARKKDRNESHGQQPGRISGMSPDEKHPEDRFAQWQQHRSFHIGRKDPLFLWAEWE